MLRAQCPACNRCFVKQWPFALRLGMGLLLLGSGPLALFILASQAGLIRDPDPNPIGFGLLAFFSFWPALFLIIVGCLQASSRRR